MEGSCGGRGGTLKKTFLLVFANVDLVVCELHGGSLAPQHVARLIRNVVFGQHNPL
jgi:hypothetical protein